jgi:hypothetical protein
VSPAVPKVKPGDKTRTEQKREKRAQEALEMRECYRKVDDRENMRCRITRAPVNPHALSATERGEHHHVNYRSTGGGHTLDNVILISRHIHEQIHAGRLRVSGDAEERDDLGRLVGIVVERLTAEGWRHWKCC